MPIDTSIAKLSPNPQIPASSALPSDVLRRNGGHPGEAQNGHFPGGQVKNVLDLFSFRHKIKS
jgi:hypothetical protein